MGNTINSRDTCSVYFRVETAYKDGQCVVRTVHSVWSNWESQNRAWCLLSSHSAWPPPSPWPRPAVSPGQCSPLPLVEVRRGSTLIGRELQSVTTPAILCHKEPARTSPDSSLVLYVIRIVGFHTRRGIWYRRPYAIKNQRVTSKKTYSIAFQSPY